jgi:hypothetical protein
MDLTFPIAGPLASSLNTLTGCLIHRPNLFVVPDPGA